MRREKATSNAGSPTIGRFISAAVDSRTWVTLPAVIEPIGDGWCVQDLGSRNGTFASSYRFTQTFSPGATWSFPEDRARIFSVIVIPGIFKLL